MAIVLERSTWLRDRVANTNACGMIIKHSDEPDARPASCIFGAYVTWLYTRSFTMVEEYINSGVDEDNQAVSFVGLLHFMMRTNSPRLGSEDETEWDNDEIIQHLCGTILRLLKEVIDLLVLSDVMEQVERARCFHIVAQALEWLYGRDYQWYQGTAAPMIKLRKEVVEHLVSCGPLVITDLKEEWERMLNACEGLQAELLSQRLESVTMEDVKTVALMADELEDWYQGS